MFIQMESHKNKFYRLYIQLELGKPFINGHFVSSMILTKSVTEQTRLSSIKLERDEPSSPRLKIY